jgi:hypothetical protein
MEVDESSSKLNIVRSTFPKEISRNYASFQFRMIPTLKWISSDALHAKTDV